MDRVQEMKASSGLPSLAACVGQRQGYRILDLVFMRSAK